MQAPHHFTMLDVGSTLDEEFDDLKMSSFCRANQRRPVVKIDSVDVGSMAQKLTNNLKKSFGGCHHERRRSVFITVVDVVLS